MTNTSSQKLDSVIRQIHSSVGEEDKWADVLCRIRELLRGRSAALAKHDFHTGRSEQLLESPLSPSLKDAYAKEHAVGNPWFMSSMDYQTGRVMTGDELLDRADLMRSDFYRRFLAPRGLVHWLCGVMVCSNDVAHYLAIHRAKTQAAFGGRDKDLLACLLEHLRIALENHWAFLSERSAKSMLRDVADRLAMAVFVVDSDGRVLLQNDGAEEFLARYEELDIVDSRIVSVSASATDTLAQAIEDATREPSTDSDRGERVVSLGGNTSKHRFFVSVRYAGQIFCSETKEYRDVATVLAKNPEPSRQSEMCTFSKVYRLTPAQARLTGLMLTGVSRRDAAKRLNVSENTIRSHLKQIYSKTSTHGQMELVQLHAKVCADH